MDITIIKQAIKSNAPAIMTGVGAVGVVVTALSTARATLDAKERVDMAQAVAETRGEILTTKDKFAVSWKYFVPPVISGATSIACIVLAHSSHIRRQAALVTLYQVAEKGFEEYRVRVVEELGKNKEQKIRDSIAEDHAKKNPVSQTQVILTGNGQSLFFESLSGRYFESDVETVRKAQNDIDFQCLHHMCASLNDFYQKIGIAPTDIGEEVGWNTDNRINVDFTTMISDDNRPCMIINYRPAPSPEFSSWR